MEPARYLKWNGDSSDTIVFIHGYADNAQMFEPLRTIFPNKCLISICLPMNQSEDKIYDINGLSEYVLTVLKEIPITTYSLVGFSLGGLIATDVASKVKNVRKLVLLSSFPFLIGEIPFRNLLCKVTSLFKVKFLLFIYSRLNTNKTIRQLLTGADLPSQTKILMKNKYYSIFGTLFNCLFYSGLSKYKNLNIPKKIILFQDDRALPYKRFYKYANKHGLEVATIKNGGHNTTSDYWKNVGVILKDFLQSINNAN
jgi:pimeloyl-ACP methyl ester carboxylesterase